MMNSMWNNLKVFSYYANSKRKIDNKEFLLLREAFSKTTEQICIKDFELDFYQFCSLIKAGRRAEVLTIQNCKIFTEYECNFGDMSKCKIKSLNLFNCGAQGWSNWKGSIHRLGNIMVGIDNCENLRKSLQFVNLDYSRLSKYEVIIEEEIEKYQRLEHIKFKL